jgi:hypothetical protein
MLRTSSSNHHYQRPGFFGTTGIVMRRQQHFTIMLIALAMFSFMSLIATSTSKAFVTTTIIMDHPEEMDVQHVVAVAKDKNDVDIQDDGVVVVKSGKATVTESKVNVTEVTSTMAHEMDEHITTTTTTPEATIKPTKNPLLLLSHDWTNMTLYSDQAKAMYEHQHNCTLPWIRYNLRTLAMGLGSELHVWSYVLNESMRFRGYRLRTHPPLPDRHRRSSKQDQPSSMAWDWLDRNACGGDPSHVSQMDCYFPGAEPNCGVEQTTEWANRSFVPNQIDPSPNTEDTVTWRAASMEYLFSSMSQLVVDEAERQAREVFGKKKKKNDTNGTLMEDDDVKEAVAVVIPKDLILVHMRWGDKFVETKLLPVEEYISAIQTIVGEQNLTEVNILLCTEDPAAMSNFQNKSHAHGWNVYIDHFYTEFEHYRLNRSMHQQGYPEFNVVANVAQELDGKPGLWAIASVLVAMESKYYILTLSSNWSRLYNELRKNIVDPRCNNCTVMMDLGGGGEF